MHLTQGTFSFLPALTDAQIEKQVKYCLRNEWAVGIEYTDDPHPRNTYWEMWGQPRFDLRDPAGIMRELAECRGEFPEHYIRIVGFDSSRGWETPRLSFIVNRPTREPGMHVERQETAGRSIRYTVHSYATDKPAGERY